ncbi:hypothetical protein CVT24_005186 [Panaeolus cyanescens]|uniref:Protein kinase domain-containing protein n=1 Tax=Panaeolus cyanescens TaxID=181874 RepID=A0A409Y973_9AGAR|nr:hypothetical protein CVT24_005186 [Panaeolus cyanescens]
MHSPTSLISSDKSSTASSEIFYRSASPSPETLSQTSASPHTMPVNGYPLYDSPEEDMLHAQEEPDAHSDSTLEDEEAPSDFGHPLQRMPRLKSADHGLVYDPARHIDMLLQLSRNSIFGDPSRTGSFASTTSSLYDTIDFEQVVHYLLDTQPNPFESVDSRNLVMYTPPVTHTLATGLIPPLMIKRLSRSSPELLLLLEMNHPEYREDPWNALPHILHAVEKDDQVFLCMKRLSEFNEPPLLTVAHYIDLFRQILERLSFLHEHGVAGLSCDDPASYMVDLSSAPHTPAPISEDFGETSNTRPQSFDRTMYPVQYYFVNFTNAERFATKKSQTKSSPVTPSSEGALSACPFKRDVQNCGRFMDGQLQYVPQILPKFKPLIKAMTVGGFNADDSRRLFEALSRNLEAPTFESRAQPPAR